MTSGSGGFGETFPRRDKNPALTILATDAAVTPVMSAISGTLMTAALRQCGFKARAKGESRWGPKIRKKTEHYETDSGITVDT